MLLCSLICIILLISKNKQDKMKMDYNRKIQQYSMSANELKTMLNSLLTVEKGNVIRPRTVTVPVVAYYDSQTKYVTICNLDSRQLVYYEIYFIFSDFRIEGTIYDCQTTRIGVSDQTGPCILTFKLDDGSEYEGTICL